MLLVERWMREESFLFEPCFVIVVVIVFIPTPERVMSFIVVVFCYCYCCRSVWPSQLMRVVNAPLFLLRYITTYVSLTKVS